MLTGLRDRLERELSNTAPHTAKVKVTTPSNAVERRFSTWIGRNPAVGVLADIGTCIPCYCSLQLSGNAREHDATSRLG